MTKAFNLIEKYQNDTALRNSIKNMNLRKEHPKFKVGDVIEFYSGYDDDILYRSEITGFDPNGDIYVLWDSCWFPIQDDSKRRIKLIENQNFTEWRHQ